MVGFQANHACVEKRTPTRWVHSLCVFQLDLCFSGIGNQEGSKDWQQTGILTCSTYSVFMPALCILLCSICSMCSYIMYYMLYALYTLCVVHVMCIYYTYVLYAILVV